MKKKILAICIVVCNVQAMHVDADEISLYKVLPDRGLQHPVTEDDLTQILPAQQCGSEGTIESLIMHLQDGWISKEKSLELTHHGIKGSDDFSVTMIRSDVSAALGGAEVVGDHMHVAGIDLGIKHLKVGDLIVIKDPKISTIKAVLLKTYIEHVADKQIRNACGKRAVDLLNAERKYNFDLDYTTTPIHGIRDRLRGVKLTVLKAGKVAVGDQVVIYPIPGNEIILQQHGLNSWYYELLQKSKSIGESQMQQNNAEKIERTQKSWGKNKKNFYIEVGMEGIVILIAAFGSVALCLWS